MTQDTLRSNTSNRRTGTKAEVKGALSSEERRQRINEEAYNRAEQRNFENGNPEQDWIGAELEVDLQLAKI